MRVFASSPPSHGNEDRVRGPIEKFLRNLVGDDKVEGGYSLSSSDRCDILLPEARLLIETKAPNKNCTPDSLNRVKDGIAETCFDQLDRYIRAVQTTDYGVEGKDLDPWIGILTNGKVWYAWEWSPSSVTQIHHPVLIKSLNGTSYSHEIDVLLTRFAKRKHGKPWIPDNPAIAFRELRESFQEICDNPGSIRSLDTQKDVWKELIQGSGLVVGDSRREALYRNHVFLLAISRAVSRLFRHVDDDPRDLLKNSYASWIGDSATATDWLLNLVSKVESYNWRARPVDVLRKLYQDIIPKVDRKLYGEYYTPDWLAELICEEMLDDDWLEQSILCARELSRPPPNVGVLDPTCGSGTFLYHAARRIVTATQKLLSVDTKEQSRIAAWLITGIDIHPVAVEMARATLLRALPDPTGIEPNIYQGDALLVSRQGAGVDSSIIGDDEAIFEYPFSGDESTHTFSIPYTIFDHGDMSQRIETLVDSAKGNERVLPAAVVNGLSQQDVSSLNESHQTLKEVIQTYGDGVWTWFIRNQLAPHVMKGRKADRIVSNPPWLRMNEIQVPQRKAEIERLAKRHNIWGGGQNSTSFDIASVFVAETRKLYLSEKGKSAYVLNNAALRSKNWEKFRLRGHSKGAINLAERYPDQRSLKQRPFVSSDSCIVGMTNPTPLRLVMKEQTEQQISREWPWREVEAFVERIAEEPDPPWLRSVYFNSTRNGATIFPAVLLRINPTDPTKTLQPPRAKAPWAQLPTFDISDIPEHWRTEYLASDNLQPFCVVKPLPQAIIPQTRSGELLTDEEARRESLIWRQLSDTYHQYKGIGKNTPKDLISRIDRGSAWRSQYPIKPCVIYNASGGEYLRAAVANYPIEHKLYRVHFENSDAAHYLCAMLNAEPLRPLFLRAKDSKLDFDKTPLAKIPIPNYESSEFRHRRLVAMSIELHQQTSTDPIIVEEIGEIAREIIINVDKAYKRFLRD